MALINCFECNKMVSDTAKVCPCCGFDIKKMMKKNKRKVIKNNLKEKLLKNVIVFVIGIVAGLIFHLLMITGCQEKIDENKISHFSNFITISFSDKNKITEFVETAECNNQVNTYYQKEGGFIKVYFVCMDEIEFREQIDKGIEEWELVEHFFGNGTTTGIYTYKLGNYLAFVCSKLDANLYVYLGDENLEYQKNYCE